MNTVKDFGDSPAVITDLLYVVPPEVASWIEQSVFAPRFRNRFEELLTAQWATFSLMPVAALFIVADQHAEDEDFDGDFQGAVDSLRNELFEEGCMQSKWDVVMAMDATKAAALFRLTDDPFTTILELTEQDLAELPAGLINTLTGSYSLLGDDVVNEALRPILDRYRSEGLPFEQEAIENELKIALDTDMLVDP